MDFINLNKRGRFGKIYKVVNKKKGSKLPSEMIAKVFRKNKNFEDIKQEYTIQKQIKHKSNLTMIPFLKSIQILIIKFIDVIENMPN